MNSELDVYVACLAHEIAREGTLVGHYERAALSVCRSPEDRLRVARVRAGLFA